MNKKIKSGLTSILIISALITMMYYNYTPMKNQFISEGYQGIIIKKYEDPENKYYETLEILTSDYDKRYTAGSGSCELLYNDALLGDSVIKYHDSEKLLLKRGDSIIHEYIFDWNKDVGASCFGYRRIREGE